MKSLINTIMVISLITTFGCYDMASSLNSAAVKELYYKENCVGNNPYIVSALILGSDTLFADMNFEPCVEDSIPIWGHNYIDTKITFKGHQFDLRDVKLYDFYCNEKTLDEPLTYWQYIERDTLNYLYLRDKVVVINADPFGCNGSGCIWSYYFVFLLNGETLDLCAIKHPFDKSLPDDVDLFMMKNGELMVRLPFKVSKAKLEEVSDISEQEVWEFNYYQID